LRFGDQAIARPSATWLWLRQVCDHADDVDGTIGLGRVSSTPGRRFADISIARPAATRGCPLHDATDTLRLTREVEYRCSRNMM
jgi:hypothetical protein